MVKEHKAFPGYRWDQVTGEGRIFQKPEDVPEGWLDHHPNHNDGQEPPKPANAATPLTREQIIAALRKRAVAFKGNASTKALYDLLLEQVEKHEA